MTVFVLVHGTGHGGWTWQKVAPILRQAGAEVYTPTLTGVGDRAHVYDENVDLTTHIKDVANLLFYEDLQGVVLVGHSYSGMVLTGVAATAPERLGRLIHIDTYLPDPGQSERNLWPETMRAEIEAGAEDGDGRREPPSPEMMGIQDPELADWVRERITPHPMATYTEPVPENDGGTDLPCAYISCTAGPLTPVFGPFAQKAREAGWPVREIAAGHDVMLTEPEAVAGHLLELADLE